MCPHSTRTVHRSTVCSIFFYKIKWLDAVKYNTIQYNTSKINMKICLRFDWGKSAESSMSSLFLNFRGGQVNIHRNNIHRNNIHRNNIDRNNIHRNNIHRNNITEYHTMLCQTVLCHAMLYHVMPDSVMPCHTIPCYARQCYMTLTTRCWSFHVSPQTDVRCMYVALCDVNT